jgi:hypothetical protein
MRITYGTAKKTGAKPPSEISQPAYGSPRCARAIGEAPRRLAAAGVRLSLGTLLPGTENAGSLA